MRRVMLSLVLVVASVLVMSVRAQVTDCSVERDLGWSAWVQVALDATLDVRARTHLRTLVTPTGPPCHAVATTETVTNGVLTTEASPSAAAQLPTRLLTEADLIHQGSFTIPDMQDVTTASGNPPQFCAYTNGAIAFNPARNSLFIACHDHTQTVAEISIPALGGQATQLQAPRDAFEGRLAQIQPSGAISGARKIGGLLVSGNQLILDAFVYYDADPNFQAVRSHFVRSTDLSAASVRGPITVGTGYGGTHAGPLSFIPPVWQALLGGDVLLEGCCHAITSIWSQGPSAASASLASLLAATNPTPTTRLVYYPFQQHELDCWSCQSELYNGGTELTGTLVVPDTATLMHAGKQGTGPFVYSGGVSTAPYRPQVWFYDLNDLAAVKAGTKQAWEPRPYRVARIPGINGSGIGGMAYDAATGRIFISENMGDGIKPRIHVFLVSGMPQPPPTIVDTDGDGIADSLDQCPTQVGPASNNGCPVPAPGADTTKPTIGITLSASAIALGQGVDVTVTANDNVGLRCLVVTLNGQDIPVMPSPFSCFPATLPLTETRRWTPTATGTYPLRAYVRDTSFNDAEAFVTLTVTTGAPPPPPPDTTKPLVSLSVDKPTPVAGETVTLAANASDNVGVVEVRWAVNGTPLGTPDPTPPYAQAWTPSASGTYVLTAVAVDAAGNLSDPSLVTVPVSPPVPPPPPPPTVPDLTVSVSPPATCPFRATSPRPATLTGSSIGVQFQRSQDGVTWSNHGSRDTNDADGYWREASLANRTWFFRGIWSSSTTTLPPTSVKRQDGCGPGQ